jgi:hypothetical protein
MAGLKIFWRSNHQIRTDKASRDHSRKRSRGTVCVKALRPLRGGHRPALTQTAGTSAFCLRLSGNGSTRSYEHLRRYFNIRRRAANKTAN